MWRNTPDLLGLVTYKRPRNIPTSPSNSVLETWPHADFQGLMLDI